MDIAPIISLAFTMHSNKGAYALLLGSGISRSAGIPTGWDITLDLVRQAAIAGGHDNPASPSDWYVEQYGRDPDYSDLLDQLGKRPAERQQFLKQYFEPTEDEREQGLKRPTAAHHAAAQLMAEGYVRVVVTTNFDRLLEQALEERGIAPTVISNADQAKGMLPLIHQQHCIIKVHGDYLDPRIMNTASELAVYDPAIDSLLDRVFDEFGLLICGWSGEWDPALRAAVTRAPSRRFSSYWATRGDLGAAASALAKDRAMTPVAIDGADAFFTSLTDKIASLAEFARPHPLSTQAAVASLKRYITEDRHRIRLHDLILDTARDAKRRWTEAGVSVSAPEPNDDTIRLRIETYDNAMEVINALDAELGRWARPEHFDLFDLILGEFVETKVVQGRCYRLWDDLRLYPASQHLYFSGFSAARSKNYEFLGHILRVQMMDFARQKQVSILDKLAPPRLTDRQNLFCLFGGRQLYTPQSVWMANRLREHFAPGTSDSDIGDQFGAQFDEFEILMAVAYRIQNASDRDWIIHGRWGARHDTRENIIARLKTEINKQGKDSAVMRLGLSSDSQKCSDALDFVSSFAGKLNFW